MKHFLIILIFLSAQALHAQVSINSTNTAPDNSAMLDVSSTTKGMLIPRMTKQQRMGIINPAQGLMVFETTSKAFYYYDGTTWEALEPYSDDTWVRDGNNTYNKYNGNVGIDTYTPSEKLNIGNGNIRLDNSDKGISLNGTDKPIITRGFDTTTSGSYKGLGRWGLFMEPHRLTAGIPDISGKGFNVSAYDANSTVAKNLFTVTQDGNANISGKLTNTSKTGTANLVPIAYGYVRADGTVRAATSNFHAVRLTEGQYYVTIDGDSLTYDTHVIQVTPTFWLKDATPSFYIDENPPLNIPGGSIFFLFETTEYISFPTPGVQYYPYDVSFYVTIYKPQ